MARETSFWRWLAGRVPAGHFTRIESEAIPGVPDVAYTLGQHATGWIELKSLAAPKRDSAHPLRRRGLNPDQIAWITEETIQGGIVWIFVKLGRFIYIFPGQTAPYLNEWNFGQIKFKAHHILPLGKRKSWVKNQLRVILHSAT